MDERPINLTVQLPAGSSMFPSWLTVLFIGAFVIASVALLLVWEANRDLAREVRVLQVHAQDIENVLIRRGEATRQDFVQWEAGSASPTQSPTPAARPTKER